MPAVNSLSPQLLSRASTPPNGEGWIHEIKYDGFRLMARLDSGRPMLVSRPGADWTARLPEIADALRSLPVESCSLDGELVYLTEEGFPDFEALQRATRKSESVRLYYQVFDLLDLDGRDLTGLPLLERKQQLVALLKRADNYRLRFVAHVEGNALEFFNAADKLGLEGIVSKRARSMYRPGVRSSDWVKVKCFRSHTFSIVGYTTEPLGGRVVLSSLALAAADHPGTLCYAGRVEFGVPRRDDTLLRLLQSLARSSPPIAGMSSGSTMSFVEPVMSAQVRCLAWLPGRRLRHAVLNGVSCEGQSFQTHSPHSEFRGTQMNYDVAASQITSAL